MSRSCAIVALVCLSALVGVTTGAANTAARQPFVSTSPDGKWILHFGGTNGYGSLDMTDKATGKRYRMYHSRDACCDYISWVPPHNLVFVDDYHTRLLNPDRRQNHTIANWSKVVVSRDGKDLAGSADNGPHAKAIVGVLRTDGSHCRAVPRPSWASDYIIGFVDHDRAVRIVRYHDQQDGSGSHRFLVIPLASLRPSDVCTDPQQAALVP